MQFKRKLFLFLLLIFFSIKVVCQDQRVADSLKVIYWSNPSVSDNFILLDQIVKAESRPDSSLKYANIIIEEALSESNTKMVQVGYVAKGGAYMKLGDYEQALEALFKSADYALKIGDQRVLGNSYISIANVYSLNNNSKVAAIYYTKGLKSLRKAKDTLTLGRALYNVGDEYIRINKLDSALAYTKEASNIFQKYENIHHQAYSLGNLGRINAKLGNDDEAEENLNKAINLLEPFGDLGAMSEFLTYMADIYFNKGREEKAIEFAKRSLELAQKHGLKEDIADANLKLSELYEKAGNIDDSYAHFKAYIAYRDSVKNIESIREMANLRTNFEVSRKQTEVDLLNQQKKNQRTVVIATVVALILILLLAFGLYRRNKFIGRTKKIIEREKNRSEILLLNILPQETASELKEKGKVQPKRFESVTILFTDFKNFTHYAENLSPEELVESVDFYFSEFDRIVEKYGLEKIKTVGDAYMCASGVPFPSEDHAFNVVSAACEMIQFVDEAKKQKTENQTRFEMRIGINTGPVIAGVVGTKKFAYDIWGDTVNIASRMESSSEAGKINIAENTYKLVKDRFECEYRGEVSAKNKGMMKMYFVKWC